jgi:uncharacterized protein (TIGR02186 family)
MKRALVAAMLAAMLAAIAFPTKAERLVSTLSSQQVLITSSFDGTVLSLFGSIEGDTAEQVATGPYNVLIVIEGPRQDRVTRIKTNSFGIWSNTDHVSFEHFPSFYAVVSSGRLDNIIDPAVQNQNPVLPIGPGRRQERRASRESGSRRSWCV